MREIIKRLQKIIKELKTTLAILKANELVPDEQERLTDTITELETITNILQQKSSLDAQLTDGFLRWSFASDPEVTTERLENILKTLQLLGKK